MSEQEQHDTSNGVPNEPNDQHHAAPTAHGERHAINPDAAQDDVRGLVLDGRFDDDPPSVGSSNGLEYGALDSQFPATYDPYIYGHPDTDDALGAALREPRPSGGTSMASRPNRMPTDSRPDCRTRPRTSPVPDVRAMEDETSRHSI